MDSQITKEQLQAVLNEDMDKMLEDVVGAMNRARPGSIIDDSEERVRQAAGEFRRRLGVILVREVLVHREGGYG